jgi:hypothetical protein
MVAECISIAYVAPVVGALATAVAYQTARIVKRDDKLEKWLDAELRRRRRPDV